jgi:hypothetical protein
MTDDDVRAHLDALAKPRGSMGRLEDVAVRLASASRSRLRRRWRIRLALGGDGHDGGDDPRRARHQQRARRGA